MRRVDLTHANLAGADLAGADLTEANLGHCILTGGRLAYAMLAGALLNGANLCGADLREVDLVYAALNGVSLTGADLTGAHWSKTVLARCRDLHLAGGLASIDHASPSALDVETLRHCGRSLPREFLEGSDSSRRRSSGCSRRPSSPDRSLPRVEPPFHRRRYRR